MLWTDFNEMVGDVVGLWPIELTVTKEIIGFYHKNKKHNHTKHKNNLYVTLYCLYIMFFVICSNGVAVMLFTGLQNIINMLDRPKSFNFSMLFLFM